VISGPLVGYSDAPLKESTMRVITAEARLRLSSNPAASSGKALRGQ
jgi:hypothetical protein